MHFQGMQLCYFDYFFPPKSDQLLKGRISGKQTGSQRKLFPFVKMAEHGYIPIHLNGACYCFFSLGQIWSHFCLPFSYLPTGFDGPGNGRFILHPFVCSPIPPSIHTSIYLSVYQTIRLSTNPSIHPPNHPFM